MSSRSGPAFITATRRFVPSLIISSTISRVAVLYVEDPADPRPADYRNVPDPVLLADAHAFVAEGRLVVRRLLTASRLAARSVMVTAAAFTALADVLDPDGPLPIYIVPQAVMNGVTGFNIHRGCLAIGERGTPLDWRCVAAGARRLVILERVANADNVGAIFRHAAAFGTDGVLLGPGCTDPLYRKAIRTSMGAALTVPFAHVEPWPEALRILQADGVRIVGLTPGAGARPLREVAETLAGARVALLAGHEGDGLTPEALDACDVLARIPTTTAVDSLNVATATALALYEFNQESRIAIHE